MKIQLATGETVEGERLPFESVKEPWTECRLEDGTIIKLKLVVSDVMRLDQDNVGGEPQYVVKSSNVMSVETPEDPDEAH